MSFFKRRRTRRRAMGGAAVGLVVATALVAQMSVVSNASWNDAEWVNAGSPVETVDCSSPEGALATRGNGRALSGALLGIDLDDVAEASGVTVTNNGQRDIHTPQGALPATAAPAWADPLNVGLLGQAINLDLGNGLLQLPLDNSTGAVGQFGSASTAGLSQGAAGFINSSGGIATAPGSGYPNMATLKLSQLLAQINPGAASQLSDVSDVSLNSGAVTGRATLDGCDAAWNGVSPRVAAPEGRSLTSAGNLEREYLTSHLTTDFTSPTVGQLVTGVDTTVTALETAVNGLSSNAGVLTNIKSGVTTLLNGLLSGNTLGVRLGEVTISSLSATIDTSQVRTLLTQGFGDANGVVTLSPSAGTVSIDTAALLAAAYPAAFGAGLNALPPNTDLLADAVVANALTQAITSALDDWIARVNTALTQAVDAINLTVKLSVTLELKVLLVYVPLVRIDATSTGTLSSMTTTTSTTALGLNLLTPLIDALIGTLVSGLVSGLGGVVQSAVGTVVDGLRTLPPATLALTSPIITAVSGLYNALYLSGVVQLLVNAQNDPFTGGPEPPDWASITPGRYDVAALRIGVLGALGQNDVRLYLGRGSVGPVCSQAEVAAGSCPNY